MNILVEKVILKFNKIYVKGDYSLLNDKLETNYKNHHVTYHLDSILSGGKSITLHRFDSYGYLDDVIDFHKKVIEIVTDKNKAILYMKHENNNLVNLATVMIKTVGEGKVEIKEFAEDRKDIDDKEFFKLLGNQINTQKNWI